MTLERPFHEWRPEWDVFAERPWAPYPAPSHWKDSHLLAIEVCNLIPRGRWARFGNMAGAYNDTVQVLRLRYDKRSGHRFAILIHDGQVHQGDISRWTVPWHRIRNRFGLCQSRGDGEVVDPNEKANRLWRMENGATDGPAASPRQEIDMARAFRTGEIQRPRTGEGER